MEKQSVNMCAGLKDFCVQRQSLENMVLKYFISVQDGNLMTDK